MKKRQLAGISISTAVLLLILILPVPTGLTVVGKNTIGLALFFLLLLMTEALPPAITCFLTISLTPLLGVTEKFAGAVSGFSHPVVFFVISSFGISAAVTSVPLTKRILLALLKAFGNSVETMLLAMMIATAVVSSIMSNIPTTAIFMAITLGFIDVFENEKEKSSIGKTFMIAIPIASMIGGMMTPAGSSLNLLSIGLLEQFTGETVTFVQWMFVGIPVTIIMIPLAWFIVLKVYKPAQIDKTKIRAYIDSIDVSAKIEKKELYVLIIVAAMLTLWILSSWVRSIEVYTVALLGCCVFFLPGINVLDWKNFVKGIAWEVVFITGTVLSTGNAMVNNGVSDWLVNVVYSDGLVLELHVLIAFVALFVFLMLLIIPIAPALITMLAGPLVTIAVANGCPPELLVLTLALCASNCYLFPLDSVPLLTFSTGYYRMTDMPKSTIFLQIAMVIILALWLPFIASFLNLA